MEAWNFWSARHCWATWAAFGTGRGRGAGASCLWAAKQVWARRRWFAYSSSRQESEARLLMGWCDPLSTPRPLGPLIDMAAGAGGELGDLVSGGAERDRLLPGVLAELQRGPVLMVVEDGHWADEATFDLLRYLGRRIDRCPALVLVTYRDDEIGRDHPLKRLLGDLATAPGVRRLKIEPLTEPAVARLAGERAVDAAGLYRKTGGNPFYVTEILSAGGEQLPGTVRDAVLARADRLSPAAREVLAAAAVIGTAVEPWLLDRILFRRRAYRRAALRTVWCGRPMVAYSVPPELAREAIYDAVSGRTEATAASRCACGT